MSEAYYISGCQLPAGSSLDDILKTVISSAGVKPSKIEEVHLFSDSASALFQRRIDTVFGPLIQWPLIPSLPVSALFSACRALETGELSTCVLVENSAQSANAILLANPNAVGRYNLSPQVHLSFRSNHPGGIIDLPGSAAKLIAAIPVDEPEPEDETPDLRVPPKKPARPWLAVCSPERTVVPDWPEDRLISGASLFPVLMKLVEAVQSTSNDPGVWAYSAPDEPGATMLVLPL